MHPRPRLLLTLLALVACGGGRTAPGVVTTNVSVSDDEAAVTAVIGEALQAEAQGRRSDSLYAASAVVVVNGRNQFTSPRFAGIAPGGTVAVTSSQLQIRSGLAWGLVNYRWASADNALVREGRATLVLAVQRGGVWRIIHAHSSSPR